MSFIKKGKGQHFREQKLNYSRTGQFIKDAFFLTWTFELNDVDIDLHFAVKASFFQVEVFPVKVVRKK